MISPGSAPASVHLSARFPTLAQNWLTDDEFDKVVDSLAGLDKHHHSPWLLELRDKLFNGMGTNDGFALGFVGQEGVDLGNGAVEADDGESVVGHVEDEVLAHDGQADEAEISTAKASV
jgi:hypothetical protein